MEPITLQLLPEQSPKMVLINRSLYAVFGVINIIQGILNEGKFGYFSIGIGAMFLLMSLSYDRITRGAKPIVFDDNAVEGPLDGKRSTRCQWSDVAVIDESMFALTFHMKAGETHTIDLSSITYAQHREVKPKIVALAKSKGIDVRTV